MGKVLEESLWEGVSQQIRFYGSFKYNFYSRFFVCVYGTILLNKS